MMKRFLLYPVLIAAALFFAGNLSADNRHDVPEIDSNATKLAPNLQFPGRPFDLKGASEAGEPECVGDPVNTVYGYVKTFPQVDFILNGPFDDMVFYRRYYSLSEYDGPFGYGWTYSYNFTLTKIYDELFEFMDQDGKFHMFEFLRDKKEFEPVLWKTYSLVRQLQNPGKPKPVYKMICTAKDGTKYIFPDVFWKEPNVHCHVSAIEYNNKTAVRFAPDDGSLPTQIIDAHGRIIRLSYSKGRVTEIFEPGRPHDRPIRFSYDDHGNLTTVSYPVSADTTYTRRYYYDSPNDPHDLTRLQDEHGFSMSYEYDKSGRCVISQGDDIGEGPLYKYLFQYKPEEQQSVVTRCRGNEKFVDVVTYSDMYGMNNVVKMEYVESGEIQKYKGHFNARGVSTVEQTDINLAKSSIFKKVVKYDEKWNATEISLGVTKSERETPDTVRIKVSYDDPKDPAKPTSIRDQNDNLLDIPRDRLDKIEELLRVKEAETLGLPPDIEPFLAKNKDEADKAQEWQVFHDEHGLLQKVLRKDGACIEYIYDGAGRCIQLTEKLGDEERRTTFVYDWLGRITKVMVNEAGSTRSEIYEYDAADKLYPQASYAVNKIAFDGKKTQFLYKKGDFLWKVISFGNGVTPSITTYEHDSFGNLIRVILPDNLAVTFTYDSRDRLIGIQGSRSVLNSVLS